MSKINKIQFNSISNSFDIQLIISNYIEEVIPKENSVRLLSDILEGFDYSKLLQAYSPTGRPPSVSPKKMFKILLYAYICNIYSSRKIESACLWDVRFWWLLEGDKAPDHSTISRFRTDRLKNSLEDFFNQLVSSLEECNEIAFENLFVDGTKFEANANRYTFVWAKAVSKHADKLHETIRSEFLNISNIYPEFSIQLNSKDSVISSLKDALLFLENLRIKKHITFVYGRGKRKDPIQRFYEKISEYISRCEKYDMYFSLFNGRNSFSKTDVDATFMRLKDDHMRNGQLKPAYNVQIGVEAEYIVGVDVFSDRTDYNTLIPFMEKLNTSYSNKYKNIIADAGYESEENYMYLESKNIDAYIKPLNYESSKKKTQKKKYLRENMVYVSEEDYFLCPNERRLIFIKSYNRKSSSGYKSTIRVYECESCIDCKEKSKCTRAKNNRQIHVSFNFNEKRRASLKKITSPEGIVLRMNRSIQVEGAFGVLKEDYSFRRFLTRGTTNVKIEITLLAMAYNVKKLSNKKADNRCGVMLFEKPIS